MHLFVAERINTYHESRRKKGEGRLIRYQFAPKVEPRCGEGLTRVCLRHLNFEVLLKHINDTPL